MLNDEDISKIELYTRQGASVEDLVVHYMGTISTGTIYRHFRENHEGINKYRAAHINERAHRKPIVTPYKVIEKQKHDYIGWLVAFFIALCVYGAIDMVRG